MKNKFQYLERFLTEEFKKKEKNNSTNSYKKVNFETAQKLNLKN